VVLPERECCGSSATCSLLTPFALPAPSNAVLDLVGRMGTIWISEGTVEGKVGSTSPRADQPQSPAGHSAWPSGRVPVLVEKRTGAFFRLVKCTTSRPPWQAATGGTRHGEGYQGSCGSAWV